MFCKRFLAYSLLCSAISFPVFSNSCLDEMDSRVYSYGDGTKELYLGACGLTDEDMPKVRTFLEQNPSINALAINYNDLGDKGAIQIADCAQLKFARLSENHIGMNGVRALAKNKSFLGLSLDNNPVGAAGAKALAKNKSLLWLSLINTKIGNEGAKALIETNITLELSKNHLDNKALNVAHPPMGKNRYIYLSDNNIDKEGARIVAKWLRDDLYIELDYNPIGNEGALALAEKTDILRIGGVGLDAHGLTALVQLNKHFEELRLDNNAIGNEGAFYLGQLDVPTLFIQNIGIDAEGARILTQGLQNTSTVSYMSVGLNAIGDEGITAIASLDSLVTLSASETGISDIGAIALATKGHMSVLVLTDNQISDQGAIALAAMPSLELLNVSYNQIGRAGITALEANLNLYLWAEGNPGYETKEESSLPKSPYTLHKHYKRP